MSLQSNIAKVRELMKKRSIGLLIMTVIDGVIYAVLQRRGWFNFETSKPESWPNTYQPTMHGRINPNDRFDQVAIWREGFQELGPALTQAVMEHELHLLHTTNTETENIMTYGVLLPLEAIKTICLSPSTGGLRFIRVIDLNRLVKIEGSGITKTVGQSDNWEIAMFEHNIINVRRAFEVFTDPLP